MIGCQVPIHGTVQLSYEIVYQNSELGAEQWNRTFNKEPCQDTFHVVGDIIYKGECVVIILSELWNTMRQASGARPKVF